MSKVHVQDSLTTAACGARLFNVETARESQGVTCKLCQRTQAYDELVEYERERRSLKARLNRARERCLSLAHHIAHKAHELKRDLGFIAGGQQMNQIMEGKRPWPIWLIKVETVILWVWWWLMEHTVCKIKGHNLESNEAGGEGSTYVSATCQRCGRSWGGYF